MKRNSIAVIVIGGLLAVLMAISAEARSVERFRIGNWNGNAYLNDANGRFGSCVASASYRSGISLSVQVDGAYNWFIGFSSDSWNMTAGNTIPLQYRIDRGAWQQGSSEVISPKMIRMQMPPNGYLVTRFRRGRLLQVFDGSNSYKFRLTGTNRLLARLGRCVERNSVRYGAGSGFSAPPAPGSSAPQPGAGNTQPAPANTQPAPVDAGLQIEATQALFNMMAKANLSGLKLVADPDREDSLKGLHAVASGGGRTVVAHIFPAGSYKNEQDLLAQVIADSAKTCQGSFQSGTDTATESGKALYTSYAHCTSGDDDLVERVVIVPRAAGGIFVYGVSDSYTGTADATVSPPELTDPDLYLSAAEAAN